jgi:23S rRNA pseudouridine1911/1915/1917 synthase
MTSAESSLPPLRPDQDLYMDERYEILFEDPDLMIVSKGAPLPVHPVSRFQERNLLSMLEREYGQKMHLANRLDSETSGLLLVARNEEMAGALGSLLQSKKVRKEYLAVVMGAPPENQGWIRAPIKGRRDLLCHVYEPHPEGKNAETEYAVLEKNKKYSLLRLVAHTGKTHQLRVHLKSIGCPIAGDKIYIDLRIYDHYVHHGWQDWMAETVGCSRLALHACLLELNHPLTKQKLKIESPLPEELLNFFKQGGQSDCSVPGTSF